jgi:septation ring formation regulator EzrA
MMRRGVAGGSRKSGRYMFFSNLELIKHHAEVMLAMDTSKIESILENGHDWAADHIATAKESIDQVFDFFTTEAAEGHAIKNNSISTRKHRGGSRRSACGMMRRR